MRIIVTGGRGMLGCTLVPYLQAKGHDVATISRGTNADHRVDLRDGPSLKRVLENADPEVIVNLAALTNVNQCEADPGRAYEANSLVVQNLSQWIKSRNNTPHLVQISTDQLYLGGGPHSEDNVCPINYYAFSKLAGELIAAEVNPTILRTNFFGISKCSGRQSLSDWLVEILRNNQAANVFEDILFSPLSMTTLSQAIETAIDQRTPGIYNLGSRDGASKAEFAFKIARYLSLSPDRLVRVPAPQVEQAAARRPLDMRMDSSLFERTFAFALPTLDSEIQLMRDEYA
jgi:dTDP-4-dehydrorhamnose reductase